MELIDHLLRFAAITQVLSLAALLIKDLRASLVGRLGALFALGVAAYLVCSSPDLSGGLRTWGFPVLILCIGNPLFFWLFARALFDDEFRLTPLHGILFAALEGLVLWRLLAPIDPAGMAFAVSSVLSKVASLAFILLALAQAFVGRAADLVEARRRFRLVFVGAVGAYMVLVVTAELVLAGSTPPALVQVLNAGIILSLAAFFSFRLVVLRANDLLVVEPAALPPAAAPADDAGEAIDAADRTLLEDLRRLMEHDRVYRRDGLTIGVLAKTVRVQETRLRRLINRGLGFRNFNAFLNAYRIDEARDALADPRRARIPVLTIAMDLGYGSLGPFNRAFKAATGMTPTEFRHNALSEVP